MDTRRIRAGQRFNAFARVMNGRASRCMHQHNCLRLPNRQHANDVVDMQMHARARAIAMIWFKERALSNHDLRVSKLVTHEVLARRCVTGVGDEWNVHHARDFGAARTQITQHFLR